MTTAFRQFSNRGLRPHIEEMIAQGKSIKLVAQLTGASERYVEDLAVRLRSDNRQPIALQREGDERYSQILRSYGGFTALDFPSRGHALFWDGEKMRKVAA